MLLMSSGPPSASGAMWSACQPTGSSTRHAAHRCSKRSDSVWRSVFRRRRRGAVEAAEAAEAAEAVEAVEAVEAAEAERREAAGFERSEGGRREAAPA